MHIGAFLGGSTLPVAYCSSSTTNCAAVVRLALATVSEVMEVLLKDTKGSHGREQGNSMHGHGVGVVTAFRRSQVLEAADKRLQTQAGAASQR